MPGSVRLKLEHAIANHLRAYGRRHYDLLRDDPAFAPWIGSHLGARGEKRLDRAIRDVKRFQKRKLSRSTAPTTVGGDAILSLEGSRPAEPQTGEPAQQFAAAGSAVISYEELQAELRRRRAQLDGAMSACLNEYGEPVKPDLFLKLSREHRALVTASADLAKRFHADLNSQAVLARVLARVLQGHDGNPLSARALMADINTIVQEAGGIAARGDHA